jgi:hypothetical protein
MLILPRTNYALKNLLLMKPKPVRPEPKSNAAAGIGVGIALAVPFVRMTADYPVIYGSLMPVLLSII